MASIKREKRGEMEMGGMLDVSLFFGLYDQHVCILNTKENNAERRDSRRNSSVYPGGSDALALLL